MFVYTAFLTLLRMKALYTYFRITVAGTLCFAICSCSIFVSGKERVNIRTNDPNATIYVDNVPVYQGTATSVKLNPKKAHSIMAKEGYKMDSCMLDSGLSTVGAVDCVFGFFFLLPWLGLLSSGAYTLDDNEVYLNVR